MDRNEIRHEGTVESVEDGLVKVRILQTAACAECKLSAHCHSHTSTQTHTDTKTKHDLTHQEAEEKLIDVAVTDAQTWHVGDAVVVSVSTGMAARALLLGFGLPLLLMLIVFAATRVAGGGEGMAAVSMLSALIPYYILIWLCRKRIAGKIAFRIEKTN